MEANELQSAIKSCHVCLCTTGTRCTMQQLLTAAAYARYTAPEACHSEVITVTGTGGIILL